MLSPAIPMSEQLAEHFDAGDDRLTRGFLQADDLDFLADFNLAALDASGSDRAAAGDREHVFNGHQERLVGFADGVRNVLVDRVHQIEDRIRIRVAALAGAVERLERRAADDRRVVAGEFVTG